MYAPSFRREIAEGRVNSRTEITPQQYGYLANITNDRTIGAVSGGVLLAYDDLGEVPPIAR